VRPLRPTAGNGANIGPEGVLKGAVRMTTSEVAAALRDLKPRFLEGMPPPALQAVLGAATQRRFLTNSIIADQGQPAEYLFLLLQGRARYFFMTQEGQKILLRWLPAGEVFGGSALLPRPSNYLVSTEAVKNGCALVWHRATIRRLAGQHPRLLENALAIVSDYLDGYLAVHVSMTCHTARQRLAQVLVNLASGIGHKVPAGVELSVSNEDLANAANMTPFTASRLLSDWQRSGMLVKSRGKVLLRHPERLLLHEL
jgi:CRP/FNR family transcriptional regulator, nitrogen oxide reductase regulator